MPIDWSTPTHDSPAIPVVLTAYEVGYLRQLLADQLLADNHEVDDEVLRAIEAKVTAADCGVA